MVDLQVLATSCLGGPGAGSKALSRPLCQHPRCRGPTASPDAWHGRLQYNANTGELQYTPTVAAPRQAPHTIKEPASCMEWGDINARTQAWRAPYLIAPAGVAIRNALRHVAGHGR